MKINIKKIVSCIIIGALVFTTSNFKIYANPDTCEISQVVYIDGNAIEVIVDAENGIIKAQAINGSDDSSLIISENGESTATVYDKTEDEYIDYSLEVETLTKDDVDIAVVDEGGEIVKEIDDYGDIINDTYEEQFAVGIITAITIETLITALLVTAACITVSGVIYYAAKSAVKAIEKNKANKSYYYKAFIYNKNVFINLNRISTSSAISRIRSGLNIYTYTSSLAKNITLSTGLGCSSPEISDLKGKVRFYHYHTANKNGSHIFYGLPIIY